MHQLQGVPTPVEVYEVGTQITSIAPLNVDAATRLASDDTVLGWRPGPGVEVPGRSGWVTERKLGKGGFGEVWIAYREGEPRVFKFCFEDSARRALKREARLFRLLSKTLGAHPNILKVFEVNADRPPYALEAEFIEGGDLTQWLSAQGGVDAISLDRRLALVAQMADALAAAHSVGVLHKDIKPGNILIRPASEGPQVVLGDFGIGSLMDDTLSSGVSTVPGADSAHMAGTVMYMAPERLAGQPASMQADVYSLGVVLFQLMVADLTRPAASGWEVDIEEPLVREDLGLLLHGDPMQRIADAAEVARRLRTLDVRREARRVEEQRAAAAERARRFRKVAIPVGIGLAVFGLAMAVQAQRIAWEAERANREAATAQRTTSFLVDLFKVSNPSAEPPTVRQVLDQGARRLDKDLIEEPEVRARLMETIGQVYTNLGQYEPALQLSQQALQLRRQALGPDAPAVADSHHTLGRILRFQGRYDDAERAHQQALSIRKKRFGPSHPTIAQSLSRLAQLAFLNGDHAQAEKLYLDALSMHRDGSSSDALAKAATLTHLGWFYLQRSRF
ncbi:MAG: serine/threonine-protein kinase, partial [Myxococcota bacterium]